MSHKNESEKAIERMQTVLGCLAATHCAWCQTSLRLCGFEVRPTTEWPIHVTVRARCPTPGCQGHEQTAGGQVRADSDEAGLMGRLYMMYDKAKEAENESQETGES